MKKYEKIIKIFIILFLTVSIFLVLFNIKSNKLDISKYSNGKEIEADYVAFANVKNNKEEGTNIACYFNKKGDIIYIEEQENDIFLNNFLKVGNDVYAYGKDGVRKTNLITKESKRLYKNVPSNILKIDKDNNVYIYLNIGISKEKENYYVSKFIKNAEEYLEVNGIIYDFYAKDDLFYVLLRRESEFPKCRLNVYKNKKIINEYEFDFNDNITQIADIDNKIFIIGSDKAYLVNEKLKEVELDNNFKNFASVYFYKEFSNNEAYINNYKATYNSSINMIELKEEIKTTEFYKINSSIPIKSNLKLQSENIKLKDIELETKELSKNKTLHIYSVYKIDD